MPENKNERLKKYINKNANNAKLNKICKSVDRYLKLI